jgi:hypothetical protein
LAREVEAAWFWFLLNRLCKSVNQVPVLIQHNSQSIECTEKQGGCQIRHVDVRYQSEAGLK